MCSQGDGQGFQEQGFLLHGDVPESKVLPPKILGNVGNMASELMGLKMGYLRPSPQGRSQDGCKEEV